MKFPTEVFGNVVVVHTPEELGDEPSRQLTQFVSRQPQVRVVVDLDGTELLDSSGLEALLTAHETLRELGGGLCVSTQNKSNRKILEITRLDHVLEVYDSVIDAVRSFH